MSPAFPLWLDRAIRDFAPDLLHLHLPNSSAFAVLALRRARQIPWILHWHADLVASAIDRRLALAYRLYRPLEQRLLAASAKVIVTSPAYLDASEALRPWRARCAVIPLGLDPARLSEPDPDPCARARRHWGHSGLRVLAIGRLTYYKGHEVLIRAIARVPDARLVLVGAGDRRGSLLALGRSLGLSERLVLPGFCPDPELRALLATCDLVCLPSLERTEAFGLVLLEAMRFAKPVVASDIPGSGTGWVVRTAGHGLLTPPGDVDALAAALRRLEDDRAWRDRLGAQGAAALREHFAITRVAESIERLYTDVLAGRDP